MRAGEDHHGLFIEELAPLRIGVRHVHVDDDLLALFLHHRRQMRPVQRAAATGHQHRKVVRAHESDELGPVLDAVVRRRIHYSTSATACAAMPSMRPRKPRCSVVVALMLISAGVMPRSAAMLPIMRAMCGAMRGSCAMMVASMLTTSSSSAASFFATSRSSLRLSTPRNSGSLS